MKRKRRITLVTHPAIPESRRRMQQHEGTQGHQIGVCPPTPYSPGSFAQRTGSVNGLERLDNVSAFGNACTCQIPQPPQRGLGRAGQVNLSFPAVQGRSSVKNSGLFIRTSCGRQDFFQACSLYFFGGRGNPFGSRTKGFPLPLVCHATFQSRRSPLHPEGRGRSRRR